MRVLVVEDNDRLGTLVCKGLNERGFVADHAATLMEAEDAISVARYNALVLDIGLPDGDGVEWMKSRPERDGLPPTLVLTARDALRDRVDGLDAGADDYLVKPFDIEELAARLRAMLRRQPDRLQAPMRAGDLDFDGNRRVASLGGRPLDLRRRECDLLEVLVRHAGSVVRRSTIEQALYRIDEPVTPNAIEATASRLRRKLEEAGGRGLLVTVRGVGYLLRETPEGR